MGSVERKTEVVIIDHLVNVPGSDGDAVILSTVLGIPLLEIQRACYVLIANNHVIDACTKGVHKLSVCIVANMKTSIALHSGYYA